MLQIIFSTNLKHDAFEWIMPLGEPRSQKHKTYSNLAAICLHYGNPVEEIRLATLG